jgi:hypothetical protein
VKAILEILESSPASKEEIERALLAKSITVPNLQKVLDGLVLFLKINLSVRGKQWRYCLPRSTVPFRLTKDTPASCKQKYVLQDAILAVLNHDAPSTAKVLHRVTCHLHLRPFELSFTEVRSTLYQMQEAGLVKYMAPTETTEGGWYAPRKPKVKK